jgi:hypothetical protein
MDKALDLSQYFNNQSIINQSISKTQHNPGKNTEIPTYSEPQPKHAPLIPVTRLIYHPNEVIKLSKLQLLHMKKNNSNLYYGH